MKSAVGCTSPGRRRLRQLSRRGAAMVELALVMPILGTVVFGAIDFGRFAHSYIALTNATRAGADFGSMNPFTLGTQSNWQTQVSTRVAQEMSSIIAADGNTSTNALKVTATRSIEANGLWRVRVEATYPFRTLVNWPAFPQQTELKRVVEMRGIR